VAIASLSALMALNVAVGPQVDARVPQGEPMPQGESLRPDAAPHLLQLLLGLDLRHLLGGAGVLARKLDVLAFEPQGGTHRGVLSGAGRSLVLVYVGVRGREPAHENFSAPLRDPVSVRQAGLGGSRGSVRGHWRQSGGSG
jgi:hypothetical protein